MSGAASDPLDGRGASIAGCTQVIFEYWDVPEPDWDWWLDYYERNVAALLKGVAGHTGTVLMLRAGMPWREHPHKVLFPHPQMQIRPAQVIRWHEPLAEPPPRRSNVSIDLHALLQHEWTHAVVHFMTASNPRLHHEWIEAWDHANPGWRDRLPGIERAEDAISEEFFSRVRNHWDVTFDVLSRPAPAS